MKKIFLIILVLFCTQIVYATDFQVFKLDNGQKVIIKEVKENPIVIIDTWIKTGSINETDKNNGVAHFLEHMFFKGTQKYPLGEFDKQLESKGALTNAATSKDFTHYYITLPSKDFDTALEMHADMILNAVLPPQELEKERKVVLEEIAKNEDSPFNKLYKNLNSQIYKEHPYKRDVIGKKEIIENITRDEMMNFYDTYYIPSNMTTVIIGDVDTKAVLEKMQNNFDMHGKRIKLPKYKKEKRLITTSEIIDNADVKTGYMLMGFNGAGAKDLKDTYSLDILATILGDGKTSRLYKEVKDQKQLVYSISTANITNRDDGIFYVSTNFEPNKLEKVKRAILDEIKLIKNNSLTEEEIQIAKNIIERDTYYSRESISNIASEFGYMQTVFNKSDLYDKYIENIKKVSVKDVQKTAKKFLNPDKMAVSVIFPKDYKFSKEKNNPPKETVTTPKLIKTIDNVKDYKLPNGATLLLNNNDSNDIISMQIFIKGGALSEDIPGVSDVMARSMMQGTKKYTKNEFSEILEKNGIKISAYSKKETFNVSVKTTKNDLNLALNLLTEVLNEATFDNYEIDKVKIDILNSIKTSRDNPFSIALEEFDEMIYPNSPYSKSTIKKIEKAIPHIQKQDILEYYRNIFNPKNIVISINGNLDNEQEKNIINFFNNVFHSNSTNEIKFSNYKNSIPVIDSNQKKVVKKDIQTSWIILGWQTDGLTNQKDYATLQIIDAILGTGMSSRLFKNLRDTQGLAYQIGSSYSPLINKGYFMVYIGTNNDKVKIAEKELFKEIDKIKKEFVSVEELQNTKDKLIGNFILSQETNSEKASTLGSFEITNRGFEFYKKYPELIQSITPNDILSVANKYFNQPYVYSLVTKNVEKINF